MTMPRPLSISICSSYVRNGFSTGLPPTWPQIKKPPGHEAHRGTIKYLIHHSGKLSSVPAQRSLFLGYSPTWGAAAPYLMSLDFHRFHLPCVLSFIAASLQLSERRHRCFCELL